MADEVKTKQRLEIGHVLFIDIVGYSKLLIDEQSEALDELNRIVRNTEAAREAEATGQIISLPTGDGMALVFTGSVEDPVECALQISQGLRAQPSLPVRMGIHSGPVHHVADVNQRQNIAGAGINIAQRVMDCGDAGHILISKRVADDLAQFRRWQPYLHQLGEIEVKHGEVISVVNFYADVVGNPDPPARFAAAHRIRGKEAPTRTGLSPVGWAIFLIAALLLTLAIVSVVFAPAILRSLETRRPRTLAPPQPPAVPSSSGPSAVAPVIPEKSIAVLPFENLSRDPDNAYFAEGVQDEILTKLATVRDLKVISRTSSAKYRSKPDNLKTVAQELGVSNVLEGAVQRAADKVRVNVQLIDARADTHLWAKTYDRNFKDVLAVESEVAEEIAEALKANLSPGESHALAAASTRDPEAHDLFLRGQYEVHQAESTLATDAFDRADAFYQQALARDSNSIEAAAAIVYGRLLRHWFVSPLAPQELEKVKSIVDSTLARAPESPEAHFARGVFFYWGHRQYEKAVVEFDRALELQPNNAQARQFRGWIFRRRGEWERSLPEIQQAQELDPRDPQIPANMGGIYVSLRLWKEAERPELRALAMDPQNAVAAVLLCRNRLNGMGDIKSARRVFEGFPEAIPTSVRSFQGDLTAIIGMRPYLDVMERRFTEALQAFEKEIVTGDLGNAQKFTVRAMLHVLAGESEAAKSAGEQAQSLLEARVRERPDDLFAMTELSWVYVALGRNADALRLARQAADSMPLEKDAVSGGYFQNGLAQIEARTGAPEEAVKRLQQLLSIPAGQSVSIALLKIDPIWDPIRNRPDFQQLLSGPEQIGPNK
jgi:TolB-like protein/Flp pilus assembly protein TadD/class 3 adenylate cyclase